MQTTAILKCSLFIIPGFQRSLPTSSRTAFHDDIIPLLYCFFFFLEQKVKKKNQTLYHVTDFDNMNMNIVYTYIEIQARERGPLVHW